MAYQEKQHYTAAYQHLQDSAAVEPVAPPDTATYNFCLLAVEGLMYLAPACFFWLMLGVAIMEWPAMRDNNALQLIADKPVTYFTAAAMGFCVNLLAYMVIQTASSLTLKVS